MINTRAIVLPALLVLCVAHATRAAVSTVWPPSGPKYPPPASVPVWSYEGRGTYNSYTYAGARLVSPFHKTLKTNNATLCFHACADYPPKDFDTASDYCNSWQYNKQTKVCGFSGGTGCTTYSPDPADCVKWYKKVDKRYISGWVVMPLQ